MKTVVTRSVEEAAEFIRRGELVAFPTETVYGLGANLFDEGALAKIFEAKGRPADNPLIAHISDPRQLLLVARSVPPAASWFVDVFFPGPLTVVLPKRDTVPGIATAGLDTIGVRMPGHALAHEFLSACGTPVAAPSANRSGRPSPTTAAAVLEDLDGRIACVLEGDQTEVGLESTVVDCTGDDPVVLRAGAVSLERLQEVVPATQLGIDDTGEGAARSPGTRYKHYAPRARVEVAETALAAPGGEHAAWIGLERPMAAFALVRECASVDEYARALFAFFRACDAAGVEVVYCQEVAPVGIGLALMDRIRRASDR